MLRKTRINKIKETVIKENRHYRLDEVDQDTTIDKINHECSMLYKIIDVCETTNGSSCLDARRASS